MGGYWTALHFNATMFILGPKYPKEFKISFRGNNINHFIPQNYRSYSENLKLPSRIIYIRQRYNMFLNASCYMSVHGSEKKSNRGLLNVRRSMSPKKDQFHQILIKSLFFLLKSRSNDYFCVTKSMSK